MPKELKLKIDDEFKDLIPPLTTEEFNSLKESIIKEGCRDALVLWDNILLDGHNRYNICMENNIIFKRIEKNFDNRDDAKVWILENQLGRRNLIAAQRIDIVDKLFGLKEKKDAKERTKMGKEKLPYPDKAGQSRDKLGSKAKVSGKQYEKGIKIKHTVPEMWNRCLNNELSIDAATKEIKNEQIKNDIDKQKEEIEKGIKEPDGLFDIIVVDPPWKYNRTYDAETSRVASKYPEMDFNELMTLDLHDAKDCIVWLWTTNQFIWEAKNLLEAWGFEYKVILVWDKEKMGIGKWLRLQCEYCLLGIKGKPLWDKKNIRDIIREPRTQHSVKPEAFYKMIDDNFIGRKLDYFGRKKRKDWETYGTGQNSISE